MDNRSNAAEEETNGRHASKNAMQLETMIMTELVKSFSSA
jgi:hypothetical protein